MVIGRKNNCAHFGGDTHTIPVQLRLKWSRSHFLSLLHFIYVANVEVTVNAQFC